MPRWDRYQKCSQCGADLSRVGYNVSRLDSSVLCLPCYQKQRRAAGGSAQEAQDDQPLSRRSPVPWGDLSKPWPGVR